MSTADNFDWITPEAKALYVQLESDRDAVIERYRQPKSAYEVRRLESGEAERECRLAIKPINDTMVQLVTRHTRPKPIFIHVTPKCDHDFKGWRELEDGRGGEQVCSKCGIGAMSDSLRNG